MQACEIMALNEALQAAQAAGVAAAAQLQAGAELEAERDAAEERAARLQQQLDGARDRLAATEQVRGRAPVITCIALSGSKSKLA